MSISIIFKDLLTWTFRVCKNLEALLPYRVNSNPPDVPTQSSFLVAKFFESVPSFLTPGSATRGRRVEPAEDVVVDDSEISILLSELREEKRHILVVENHLETCVIDRYFNTNILKLFWKSFI